MTENPLWLIVGGLIAIAPGLLALIRTWKTDASNVQNAGYDQIQENVESLEGRLTTAIGRADELDRKLSRVNQKLWVSMEFNHAQQIHAQNNGLVPLPWPPILMETN